MAKWYSNTEHMPLKAGFKSRPGHTKDSKNCTCCMSSLTCVAAKGIFFLEYNTKPQKSFYIDEKSACNKQWGEKVLLLLTTVDTNLRTDFNLCIVLLQPLPWGNVVWFTTNGMCAKNKNMYVWCEQAIIREIVTHDLYCCLLPRCETLRTCHLGFPIATEWCCDQDVQVVLSSAFTQRTCDRCGSCARRTKIYMRDVSKQ